MQFPWQASYWIRDTPAPGTPVLALPAGGRAVSSRAPSSPSPTPPGGPPQTTTFAGGRLTKASESLIGGPFVMIPPPSPALGWRTLRLDARTFDSIDATELADYLVDLSPEVSRALWDFLRFCNPGFEIKAVRPGTDTPDEAAQALVDAFWKTLDDLYGSVDVVIGRLFLGMFLRGSFLAELVLDPAGRTAIDLVTPDPFLVRFRWREDPARGPVQQLCQWQNGTLVDLNRPTIRYVPVDPMPGSPYGRPLVAPALFVSLFLLVMLHDLRRVIQQQGYPRLDIEIVSEEVRNQIPEDIRSSPAEINRWLTRVYQDVVSAFASLEPDDTYVHDSKVKVNRPVGTVDASSLGAIGDVIAGLERMSVRALKTMPFLLGLSETTTETQANRQFEAYIQGIKAIQHYAETPISSLLTLMLRAQGVLADVTIEFAENRSAEELRDMQVQKLKQDVAKVGYEEGHISQDEASEMVFGHVAEEEEPRKKPVPPGLTPGAPGTPGATTPVDPNEVEPEPGSKRGRALAWFRSVRALVTPEGAGELPEVPDPKIGSDDLASASALWDRLMPARYRGLLDAEVEEEDEDEGRAPGDRAPATNGTGGSHA